MNKERRISGEQGSIKPEATLTEIVRQVAYTRTDDPAPIRAAANGALIQWLKSLETDGTESDHETVQFHLNQHGFDSVTDLVDAMLEADEPIMAPRQNIEDIDIEEITEDLEPRR